MDTTSFTFALAMWLCVGQGHLLAEKPAQLQSGQQQ